MKPDWQICSSDGFGTNFFGVNITGGVLILSIPGIVKFDEKLVAAADVDDVDVDAVLSVWNVVELVASVFNVFVDDHSVAIWFSRRIFVPSVASLSFSFLVEVDETIFGVSNGAHLGGM